MTLILTHAGRTYTLYKHPRELQRHAAGQITADQLKAQPWYLRLTINGKRRPFTLSSNDRQALADARDKLNGLQKQPEQFAAWLAEKDARRGVTVGALAADWIAAGCPFSNVKLRTAKESAPLAAAWRRAEWWWAGKVWTAIRPQTLDDYFLARCDQVRLYSAGRYTGQRTVDVELAALSCLGQWAVLASRVATNPFATRETYQDAETIRHCHHAMPENDEQFHRVLTWLWTHRNPPSTLRPAAAVDRHQDLAAGCLAFMALTGLRPGEPEFLRQQPAATAFPDRLSTALPGLIYPAPDGSRRLKVHRLKRGQNPAVLLHPALTDFLGAWESHASVCLDGDDAGSVPASRPLFPISAGLVADQLTRACAALGLPRMKPHGFGRAYYVRVRRSQGADDATIAVELGQSSNGDLIRSVYGDPGDGVGGNLYDWLPADGAPAWELLRAQTPAGILPVKFG